MLVLADVEGGERAVERRARRSTETSRVEGHEAFEDRRAPADRREGLGEVAAGARSSPGPCRHSRSGGSSARAGRPSAATRGCEVGRRVDRARTARSAMPRPATKRLLARAGPASSRAPRALGCSGARAARRSAVARRHVLELVGDDVDRRGEARRAPPRPRRRAIVCAAATSKAGLSASGAKTWRVRPSSAAASAIMRPSWPPPRMPSVAPGARR